jgi:hypothetical protein
MTNHFDLISNRKPVLTSGNYTVTIKQDIAYSNEIYEKFTTTKQFFVAGKQFQLTPNDIHAEYPPANSQADYTRDLPYLVLNSSTLPWERSSGYTKDTTPWLALLLFHEKESSITESVIPFSELNLPSSDVFYNQPQEAGNQFNPEQVSVIDVPKELLYKLVPSAQELALLAHVRKESDGTEKSVLLCNRLPHIGKLNKVYLVSLENCYDSQGVFKRKSPDKVRLINLRSWRFSSSELYKVTAAGIYSLDQDIPQKLQDHLWKNIHQEYTSEKSFSNAITSGYETSLTKAEKEKLSSAFASGNFANLLTHLDQSTYTLRLPPSSDPTIEDFRKQGFVPVPHCMSQGSRTVSWYHGPLSTSLTDGTITHELPVLSSDQLIQCYEAEGMLDMSYAAAWELGSLLAFQHKEFSTKLCHWKRNHRHTEIVEEQAQNNPTFQTDTGNIQQDHSKLPEELLNWLKELRLLKEVPFNYLVPAESMLPVGSIRFFYIDNNWRNALLDGAFSIGRISSQYHRFDKEHHQKLTDIIQCTGEVLTGFLLRSEIVASYPDLMIAGFSESNKAGNQLPVLRQETLSSNVVFCLFEGEVRSVDFALKSEATRFGFDINSSGQWIKNVRSEQGEVKNTLEIIRDNSLFSDVEENILNITALAGKLENASNGSKEFGLQMLETGTSVHFDQTLSTPTGLKVERKGDSIILSWNPVAGQAISYEWKWFGKDESIEEIFLDTSFPEVNNVTQTTANFDGVQLALGKTMGFQVRATKDSLHSQWSQPVFIPILRTPELTEVIKKDNYYHISWSPVELAEKYEVKIMQAGKELMPRPSLEYQEHSVLLDVDVLDSTKSYQIQINAKAGNFESGFSNVFNLLPQPSIINVVAEAQRIIVSWGEVAGAKQYEISVSNADGTLLQRQPPVSFSDPVRSVNLETQIFSADRSWLKKYNVIKNTSMNLVTINNHSIHGIEVDSVAQKVYWKVFNESTKEGWIKRANLDGSNEEDILNVGFTQGLAIDPAGKRIYWCDWSFWFTRTGKGILYRANLDGSNKEVIYSNEAHLGNTRHLSLDLINQKIYWVDMGDASHLYRANLDGSGFEDISEVTTGYAPSAVAVDPGNGKIYWTSYYGISGRSGDGCVKRANLDGSNEEMLINQPDADMPSHLELDVPHNKLYFINNNGAELKRANLDGSAIEIVSTIRGSYFSLYQKEISISSNQTITTFATIDSNFLTFTKSYQVKVRAMATDSSLSVWSEAVNSLPSPQDIALSFDKTLLTANWSAVTGAEKYHFELYDQNHRIAGNSNHEVIQNRATVDDRTVSFIAGQTYKGRVRAMTSNSLGVWSEYASATVPEKNFSVPPDFSVQGTWDCHTVSKSRTGRYAKYYTFTLKEKAEVTIDLTSPTDTYLYLLQGDKNGSQIASDDDGGEGYNSRIKRTLESGAYTIEATTYSAGRTGDFTLTLSQEIQVIFEDDNYYGCGAFDTYQYKMAYTATGGNSSQPTLLCIYDFKTGKQSYQNILKLDQQQIRIASISCCAYYASEGKLWALNLETYEKKVVWNSNGRFFINHATNSKLALLDGGTLRLFDIQSSGQLDLYESISVSLSPSYWEVGFTLSSDGNFVGSSSGYEKNKVSIVDLKKKKQTNFQFEESPSGVYSPIVIDQPNSSTVRLILGGGHSSGKGYVVDLDLTTGNYNVIKTLTGMSSYVYSVMPSDDSHYLVCAGYSTVKIYDIQTWQELWQMPSDEMAGVVKHAFFNPDINKIICGFSASRRAKLTAFSFKP